MVSLLFVDESVYNLVMVTLMHPVHESMYINWSVWSDRTVSNEVSAVEIHHNFSAYVEIC